MRKCSNEATYVACPSCCTFKVATLDKLVMDRDGARTGFDLALTRAIVDSVDVPVIASGGVGALEHLVEGIRDGGADAVLAASIFHYGEFTIAQAKMAMIAAGIECRV